MLFSGTQVETTAFIRNAAGALITPGTRAMVIANVRAGSNKVSYLCETAPSDEFEQEEFYCLEEQLRRVEKGAA